MKRGLFIVVIILSLFVAGEPSAFAASKPIKQLPEDVVAVSLAWVALPQAMVAVAKDHGPLAGMSWGVIKGVSGIVERTLEPVELDPSFAHRAQTPSTQSALARLDAGQLSWLNRQDAGTRKVHREPALLRYTF